MRVDRILQHEKTLYLRRKLQPLRYQKMIILFWLLNAQTIVDRFLFWRM